MVVPRGAFRTGPFNLTSHMTLFLQDGAAIYGPTYTQLGPGPAFTMWPVIAPMPSYGQGRDHPGPRRAALVGGVNLTDVIVTSAPGAWGTIDGAGGPWWACHCGAKTAGVGLLGGCGPEWQAEFPCAGPGFEVVTRGHLIEFGHSSNIEISNLNLRNSPFWTVHPFDCRQVVVRNIDIWAPA